MMAILSKVHIPHSFESHKSLRLSFTSILFICSNFVGCDSFLESISCCIMRQTWKTQLSNFSVRGYFSLIWKDSIIRVHGFAVYMNEGLHCRWLLPINLKGFLFMFSTGSTSFSVLHFPTSFWTPQLWPEGSHELGSFLLFFCLEVFLGLAH